MPISYRNRVDLNHSLRIWADQRDVFSVHRYDWHSKAARVTVVEANVPFAQVRAARLLLPRSKSVTLSTRGAGVLWQKEKYLES